MLVPLCAAHAEFERLPYDGRGHAQRLHAALSSGQLHAWLLERDRIALGYASVTVDFATLSGRPFAHLDCLYLIPRARGQGGGQALMQVVRAYAVGHGYEELQWQTPQWNHSAARFYAQLGATASAKQRFTLSLFG
jgi:GNAT superfamily N-acetyltransferase